MKKKIVIIVAALVVVVGLSLFFILKNKNKDKGYPADSIEATAETAINNWFTAMAEHDTDKYIASCYTNGVYEYHKNSTGLSDEDFKKYLTYIISADEFEYRKVRVKSKRALDEDAFYEINSKLDRQDEISHMYEIEFSYELKNDGEWQTVDENCRIYISGGNCYVFTL